MNTLLESGTASQMDSDLSAPLKTVDLVERSKRLVTRLEMLTESGVSVDNAYVQQRSTEVYISLKDFERLFAGRTVKVYHGDRCDILSTTPDDDGVKFSAFRYLPAREGGDTEIVGGASWRLVQNSTGRVIRTFASQEDAWSYQHHDSLYPVAEYTIHGPEAQS